MTKFRIWSCPRAKQRTLDFPGLTRVMSSLSLWHATSSMLLSRHTWRMGCVNTNECHLSSPTNPPLQGTTLPTCCPHKHHQQPEQGRVLCAGRWAGCTLTCPNPHWQDLECYFIFFLNKTKMLSTYYMSLKNTFEMVYESINSTSTKLNGSGAWYKTTSKTILLLTASPNPSKIILLKHLPF